MYPEKSGYLIATDEAGYGPNLGPLVIAATVWRVACPDSLDDASRAVADAAATWNGRHPDCSIGLGDSKQLFSQAKGIGAIERTALSAVAHAAPNVAFPCVWSDLGRNLACRAPFPAWLDGHPPQLPMVDSSSHIASASAFWRQRGVTESIELLAIHVDMVFPEEWNRLLKRFDKKSTVLTHRTLHLVRRAAESLPQHIPLAASEDRDGRACGERLRVHVACDKHGGRNNYRSFLADAFGDQLDAPWIDIRVESAESSCYHLSGRSIEWSIGFHCKAERWVPVGLASLVAKYLREASMAAFNRFWQGHCPGVRPTAGYPVDAKRFRLEVDTVRQRIGIGDNEFWRRK